MAGKLCTSAFLHGGTCTLYCKFLVSSIALWTESSEAAESIFRQRSQEARFSVSASHQPLFAVCTICITAQLLRTLNGGRSLQWPVRRLLTSEGRSEVR